MLHCVTPLPTLDSVPGAMGASCSTPIEGDDSEDSIPFYKAVQESDEFFENGQANKQLMVENPGFKPKIWANWKFPLS
uniref:Uncharacterized protein n=1 Tax=Panagrolaimus sp. JU765 TaxID=591449 RepID=A0AC34Q483_9BILA